MQARSHLEDNTRTQYTDLWEDLAAGYSQGTSLRRGLGAGTWKLRRSQPWCELGQKYFRQREQQV